MDFPPSSHGEKTAGLTCLLFCGKILRKIFENPRYLRCTRKIRKIACVNTQSGIKYLVVWVGRAHFIQEDLMKTGAPVGSIRKDSRWGYLWQKVENHEAFGNRWVLLHHLIWWRYRKQRVPKGCVLHHKDYSKENNKLSNLQLMTRAAHATLHGTGRLATEETKAKMKNSFKARCTPEWRAAVSKRVKAQHAAGKFGAATVSAESRARASAKISAKLKGRPSSRLGTHVTAEQREHYRQGALKREAAKRSKKCT